MQGSTEIEHFKTFIEEELTEDINSEDRAYGLAGLIIRWIEEDFPT